ncbi:MAG: 1-acyl-sn-glycerol-3-phosphate acyltransferase [Desulfobacteraceae bacterium]
MISLPLWLFVLLSALAVLAVLDRFLIPSTRWFLRRRINRVINEIGARLSIEIRAFQLTKRQVLIDRLAYDPQVLAAIQEFARENDMPQEVAQKRVIAFAREIVPSFNAYFYFRIGYWIAKKVAGLLYRVRVGAVDAARFENIDPNATVVFVMNHRSNMDYILVAFLVAERTTLSYAVGEWAKIWPLQSLIRAMGAFFVRRKSGDPLYRKVLDRYIHMATREGVCQAVFLEGGLSRDGSLQAPKLGLIDYMLREYDISRDRDIIFVPVGINYDRTLEDRTLLRELDPMADKRSGWFVVRTTLKFVFHSFYLMALSRWRRYGYACVNFNTPVSIKAYCREHKVDFGALERGQRFPEIEKLCRLLMARISKVVPVLPVSLVSAVLLEVEGEAIEIDAIEERADRLQNRLQAAGAPVIGMSRTKWSDVIADAVDFLLLRKVIVINDEKIHIPPDERPTLRYYANAIFHWRHAFHQDAEQ